MKPIPFIIIGVTAMISISIMSGLRCKKQEPDIKFPIEFTIASVSQIIGQDTMMYAPGVKLSCGAIYIDGAVYRSPNHYNIGDRIRIKSLKYGDDELAQNE